MDAIKGLLNSECAAPIRACTKNLNIELPKTSREWTHKTSLGSALVSPFALLAGLYLGRHNLDKLALPLGLGFVGVHFSSIVVCAATMDTK